MRLIIKEEISNGIPENNNLSGISVKMFSAKRAITKIILKILKSPVIDALKAFNIANPLKSEPRNRPNNAPVFLDSAREMKLTNNCIIE